MTTPYSDYLRARVAESVLDGRSVRETAKLFISCLSGCHTHPLSVVGVVFRDLAA